MFVEVLPDVLGEKFTGVRIYPNKSATNTGNMEKLTAANIQVEMLEGGINYMNMRTFAQCFIHDGRYYFSLTDIDKASKANRESIISLTKSYATGGYRTGPSEDSYTAVDVINDAQAGVVSVKINTTDLWAVFNEAKVGVPVQEPVKLDPAESTLPPDIVKAMEEAQNGTYKPVVPEFKKQAPLTEAPKIGTRLANILIDESKGAYDDTGLYRENIQPSYIYSYLATNFGECAWYAEGRFTEVTGVDSRTNEYWLGTGNVSGWLDNVTKNNCPDVVATRDKNAIKSQSIAVWNGHVAFVEYVEYDSNGNPSQVYFTETNAYHDVAGVQSGVYYPEIDCLVNKMSFNDFTSRIDGLLGYIMVK